jgi:hypothetical protein
MTARLSGSVDSIDAGLSITLVHPGVPASRM